jgi:hypothetical protein
VLFAPEESTPVNPGAPSMSWDITYFPLPGESGVPEGILASRSTSPRRSRPVREAENAIKYAYPDRRGAIAVDLRRLEDGRALLRVADSGVGLPRDFSDRQTVSLGFRMIDGLVRQLRGELTVSDRRPGTSFEIAFEVTQGDSES